MAVLITGASAGFGAAMARQFAAAGIAVIGAARRSERLDELKQQLGDLFHPLAMDVRSKESVDAALSSLAEAPEAFRRIDCLINNAGLALDLSPAHQADFADWENMIATNITGLAYLTRQVLPEMVARGEGYIINIGSIAGSYPYPGSNVYGATKAFVHQFSLNLRADLHGSGAISNPACAAAPSFRRCALRATKRAPPPFTKACRRSRPKTSPPPRCGCIRRPSTLMSIIWR